MSRRARLVTIGATAVLAALTLTAALLSDQGAAPGSALSRGALGCLAVRRYAEARGVTVQLLDRQPTRFGPDTALLIVFPLQRFLFGEDAGFVREHLTRGGTVVIGYSGQEQDRAEDQLFRALGLRRVSADGPLPLTPLRWRARVQAEWSLHPADGSHWPSEARIRVPEEIPVLPSSAEPLFRSEGGQPLAFRVSQGRGRLIVLPAEALANARFGLPGHAELVESLMRATPRRWVFDEFHHGLLAAADPQTRGTARVLDLWAAHAVLLYLLAVLALVRQFGPAWSEPPIVSGSARAFFLRLGARHARSRHFGAAAEQLAARARELDPALRIPDDPDDNRGGAAAAFLRFAQRVARAQQRRT